MAAETDGRIRVLVVDDQTTVRDGLATILSLEDDIDVVGAAADGAEAVRIARETEPQVVLMDLGMPVLDGVDATAALLRVLPATRVLVLTTYADDSSIRRALLAGATGYLTKDSGRTDIVSAVRAASRGQSTFAADATRVLLRGASAEPAEPAEPAAPAAPGAADVIALPGHGMLTEQEARVLLRIVDGQRNAEIAAALFVSVSTVKTHVNNLFAKLGVSSRSEAVERYRSASTTSGPT